MNCPHCQTALPDDAKFCGACGQTLATPPPATPTAERSQSFSGTFAPGDFARALDILCAEHDQPLPAGDPPHDHDSLRQAAEGLGLDKVAIKQALHRVSIEKLTPEERAAFGIVLDEDEAPDRSRRRVMAALLSGGALLVLVLGGVLVWWLQDEPPPAPQPVVEGAIDTAALTQAMDALAGQARECLVEAMQKKALPATEVTLGLRIDEQGAAQEVTLVPADVDDRVAQCVRTAVEEADFPAAEGAPVDVSVPLTFKSASK